MCPAPGATVGVGPEDTGAVVEVPIEDFADDSWLGQGADGQLQQPGADLAAVGPSPAGRGERALQPARGTGRDLAPSRGRGTEKALVSCLTRASPHGVSDGARTRDTQDHNLVLYQLSYTHHVPAGRERRWVTGATIPEPVGLPAGPGGAGRVRRSRRCPSAGWRPPRRAARRRTRRPRRLPPSPGRCSARGRARTASAGSTPARGRSR